MIENTPAAWSERAASGTSWEAALWSEAGQRERMEKVLAELAPRAGESLLDYGCGTGMLSEFVPEGVEYVGHDFAQGMIERAMSEHPSLAFELRWPLPRRFDLVAVVGTFNLAHGWTKAWTIRRILDLWKIHVPRRLVASAYSGDDPQCLSYDADDLLEIAMRSEAWWSISSWRRNDLLLTLTR